MMFTAFNVDGYNTYGYDDKTTSHDTKGFDLTA